MGFGVLDIPQAALNPLSPELCPFLNNKTHMDRHLETRCLEIHSPTTFMTLENFFNSSKPQYFHLKNRENNTRPTYLMGGDGAQL